LPGQQKALPEDKYSSEADNEMELTPPSRRMITSSSQRSLAVPVPAKDRDRAATVERPYGYIDFDSDGVTPYSSIVQYGLRTNVTTTTYPVRKIR
jgi:hypothetical protein